MRSNLAVPALLGCLLLPASPAFAADGSAAALDLSLPQAYRSAYRNDPPGTYYGDTTGVPPGADTTTAACPTAPDGSERALTGSATTGFGYSSGLGSSRYNALHLNYCKASATEVGSERVFNVQVDVGNYDGPGMGRVPMVGPGAAGRAPRVLGAARVPMRRCPHQRRQCWCSRSPMAPGRRPWRTQLRRGRPTTANRRRSRRTDRSGPGPRRSAAPGCSRSPR